MSGALPDGYLDDLIQWLPVGSGKVVRRYIDDCLSELNQAQLIKLDNELGDYFADAGDDETVKIVGLITKKVRDLLPKSKHSTVWSPYKSLVDAVQVGSARGSAAADSTIARHPP